MNLVATEITQTLRLPLVDQAYLNAEQDRVVVELKVDTSAGVPRENILFFGAQDFAVEQVKLAILRIKAEPTQ